jgi:hypothetical protein
MAVGKQSHAGTREKQSKTSLPLLATVFLVASAIRKGFDRFKNILVSNLAHSNSQKDTQALPSAIFLT